MTTFKTLLRRGALCGAAAGILLVGATGTAEASTRATNTALAGTVASSTVHTGASSVQGVQDCTDYLENWHYSLTVTRVIACQIAAIGLPDTARAITACATALYGTGVSATVSGTACLFGSL